MKHWRKQIVFSGLMILLFLTGCVAPGTTGWAASSQTNDRVYISFGQLYVLDSETGKEVWRFPSPANNSMGIYSPAAANDKLVVVGTSNHVLYGLDAVNGLEKWSFTGAKDQYLGGILQAGGNYFAPNNDWHLYSVSSEGRFLWKFAAKAANWSKPVTDGTLIFVASMDHNLYALKTTYSQGELSVDESGANTIVSEPVWRSELGGAVVSEPLLDNGILFVGTLAGAVKAINSADGTEVWSFGNSNDIASIWSKPALHQGTLFFSDENGSIYALDATTGKSLWESPYQLGDAIIAGAVNTPDGVVFSSKTGKSILINASKQVKELVPMQGEIYTTPEYSTNGLIYLAPNNQYLAAAIKIDGTQLWKFVPTKD